MPRRIVLHALVACAALAAGCARDPDAELCPPVGAGDLVVTELRGPQDPDSWGQWVELYNATGSDLDLEGTVIDLVSIDGGTRNRILIRASVSVAPGDYVVIGDFGDVTTPEHFDYDIGDVTTDFTTFPATGGITVRACDADVDAVIFPTLPTSGTWSLDGAPSASGNDDESAWCNDTMPSTDPSKTGLPGTPGAANHPCS